VLSVFSVAIIKFMWLKHRTDNQIILVLGLLAFALFSNSLSNQFVYDDHYLIELNQSLRSSDYFEKAFGRSHAFEQSWLNFGESQFDHYRPFTRILFALAFQAFELQTFYWHLLNVVLFCSVVALVYAVMRQMAGENRTIPIIGTLLFAVHPIHSEAVAWVNGMVETLLSLFFLSGFLLYLLYKKEIDRRRGRLFFIGSLSLYAGALLSKETALCFPILVACYAFFNSEKSFKSRIINSIREAAPYLMVVAAYVTLRYVAYGGSLRIHSPMPLSTVMMTIPTVILGYLQLLLAPFNLSAINRVDPVSNPVSLRFWLPLLLLVGCAVVLLARAPNRTTFACAWIVITMLPVLNIGVFDSEKILQDRYAFLSSIGFCLLAATALGHLSERLSARPRAIVYGSIAIIVLGLSIITVQQNTYWRDDSAVWMRAILQNPDSEAAHCNYALSLYRVGKVEESAEYSIRRLKLKEGRSRCHCMNLGSYFFDRRDYNQAIEFYQYAIALEREKAINLLVFTRLAAAYGAIGNYENAIKLLEGVLSDYPEFEEGHQMLNLMKRYRRQS
jgi:protein O-mannosyl-transferase